MHSEEHDSAFTRNNSRPDNGSRRDGPRGDATSTWDAKADQIVNHIEVKAATQLHELDQILATSRKAGVSVLV